MFDLDHLFKHHPPETTDDVEAYQEVRKAGKALAQTILDNTPQGADQSAAIRKVREACWTANAARALKGRGL